MFSYLLCIRIHTQVATKINNTDIQLAIFDYDISPSGNDVDLDTWVADPIVFGVSAPAETIIPDYIGKINDPFVLNDILYVPDGELGQNYHDLDFGIPSLIEKKEVTKETNICFTSKELIGQELFDELVDYYCISGESNTRISGDISRSFSINGNIGGYEFIPYDICL